MANNGSITEYVLTKEMREPIAAVLYLCGLLEDLYSTAAVLLLVLNNHHGGQQSNRVTISVPDCVIG